MSVPPPPERRRFPVARLVVVAAVVTLAVLLARRLDLDRLLASLREADARLVVAAALVHLTVNTAARVSRWQALLDPMPHRGPGARFAALVALYFAGQAANNLLPARAGEALRVVHLHRRHHYPVASLVTVQIVETLVGAVTLGLFTLPMVPLGEAPTSLSLAIFLFALAGPLSLGALFWLARRAPPTTLGTTETEPPRSRWGRFVASARRGLARLVEAVRQMRSPRVWVRSVAWSVLSDVSDVAMIGLVLASVGVTLSPASWVVIYAAINLVLIAPTTPAQIGVLEMGAAYALTAFGVDGHAALAFALLYHAAHVIPPTLAGAVVLARLDLRRSGEGDARAQ